jgi:hypothetical protein
MIMICTGSEPVAFAPVQLVAAPWYVLIVSVPVALVTHRFRWLLAPGLAFAPVT